MLEKLNNLIFGQGDFEKVKIEIRFIEAKELSKELIIDTLIDFKIVENVIYKIKELLRLKSSNLNKAINDPSRKIKKKDVLELLQTLEDLREKFLDIKEKIIVIENKANIKEETTTPQITEKKEEISQKIEDLNQSIEIITRPKYNIILGNKKIPYLLIEFNSQIDYSIIKKVLLIFFEEYMPEGTNIIIENKITLIIPRFNNDNLIKFPNPNLDLNLTYQTISNKNTKNKTQEESKEIANEIIEKKENYTPIEEIEKKTVKKSLKQKEESLDNLLEAINKKTRINTNEESAKELTKSDIDKEKIESQQDNSGEDKIEIIPDEPIQIEKKEKNENIKEQFIIEKKEPIKKEIDENNSYLIYQDDKLKAFLEKNSISNGEIIIMPTENKPFSQLNESDFSYLMIFSKIFSQILFEETKAQGTNLILDQNSNKIRLISRNPDDNLKLNWQLKDASEDFLEQIKNRLFQVMAKNIDLKKTEIEKNEEKPKENEIIPQSKTEKKKIPKEEPQENHNTLPQKKKDNTLEEKARFILQSLRRIP